MKYLMCDVFERLQRIYINLWLQVSQQEKSGAVKYSEKGVHSI